MHYKPTEPGPGPARDFTFTGVRRSAPECPGVDFHPGVDPESSRSQASHSGPTPVCEKLRVDPGPPRAGVEINKLRSLLYYFAPLANPGL